MTLPSDEFARPEANLAFTVDTHLLRELGALLVGRDSTALVELIKNSYDADATKVIVHGARLGQGGYISVWDNGTGMTYDDFVTKFLRIAGRSKETGARRSPKFYRKYTGAKGIGRLSAHKLGEQLALESTPEDVGDRLGRGDLRGITARINWRRLEDNTRSMDEAKEIYASPTATEKIGTEPGTLLTINQLHGNWSARQLNSFLAEVRSTRPDSALYQSVPRSAIEFPLMPQIDVADTGAHDPGFQIELSGEFAGSDAQWPTLLSNINWAVEIDARASSEVRCRISPTRRTQEYLDQEISPRDFTWPRTEPGPRFAARIFVRDGSNRSQKLPDLLSKFATDAAGVRLFFEGFRVLPYGAARNDWLGLDASYVRRTALSLGDDLLEKPSGRDTDERTYQVANGNHFGAVFLHDAQSEGLQMVVNREGFLPGPAFDQLVANVRRGLDLSVRIRAAIGAQTKAIADQAESEGRHRVARPNKPQSGERESPKAAFDEILAEGKRAVQQLRASKDNGGNGKEIQVVEAVLDEARAFSDAASDEQAQLRVLASLGTQVGAFIHEVNGLLAQSRTVRDLMDRLLEEGAVQRGYVTRMRQARNAQNELVASLERQAVYLSDSIGAEARRRRVRLNLRERWATAERLLGPAAARRNVRIADTIPSDLRTPPMFPAEMNVVFTNLLSNAIKAAAGKSSDDASIRVSAEKSFDKLLIKVENTGAVVDLRDSDRWFRPFETTTSEIDAALGQGLGLGLPLTRRIIEEYGGSISFVKPSADMASAVEIELLDE